MSTVLAIFVRDLRNSARYPVGTANLLLFTPLYQMVLPTLLLGTAFLVNGNAAGLMRTAGTQDLAGWLTLGMAVSSAIVGVIWTMVGDISSARSTGTLEVMLASSRRPRNLFVGSALTGYIFTLCASLLLGALSVALLGADYHGGRLLWLLPIMALLFVAVTGYGFLLSALILRIRSGESLLDMIAYVLAIFSGIAFPITILPQPMLTFSQLLPTTWALDLLRAILLDARLTQSWSATWLVLSIESAAMLIVGSLVFNLATRQLRRSGELSQY